MKWVLDCGAPASASGTRPRPRAPAAIDKPSPIVLGYELQGPTVTRGPVLYEDPLHLILAGVNGAGKQTRILTSVYMNWNHNLVICDVKGTAAYQTAAARARFSDVGIICPFPVLGLKSQGFNFLARLDPDSMSFRSRLLASAAAIVDPENGVGKHFASSAEMLIAMLSGWEVVKSKRERRIAYPPNIRRMGTEGDRWEKFIDAEGKPSKRLTAGIAHIAAQIIEDGHPALVDLAGRFTRPAGHDELAGIISTADVNTRFLLDPYVMRDMRGKGVDLTKLCDGPRPQTVILVLPPEQLDEQRRLSRLVVSGAMLDHFRPSKFQTLFVMDEFPVTVGGLEIVRKNWAVVREFRMQFLACVQSLAMFRDLWGEAWEGLIGQAGGIVQLGACGCTWSAEFLSKRSGVTTIPVLGYNENWGGNSGGNNGGGFGMSVGGFNSNENFGLSFGQNFGATLSVTQTERRALLAQDLMDMRPGDGRLWRQGMGSRSVPFFAPNYWMLRAPWAAQVRENPYYKA
jgi:type IV secretory pathway TraG/TraD family ATPase VirD4